jgi:hypothetical protein
MATVMRFAASDVTEAVIPDSGHWIMGERAERSLSADCQHRHAELALGGHHTEPCEPERIHPTTLVEADGHSEAIPLEIEGMIGVARRVAAVKMPA